jgi:hypothetical protein
VAVAPIQIRGATRLCGKPLIAAGPMSIITKILSNVALIPIAIPAAPAPPAIFAIVLPVLPIIVPLALASENLVGTAVPMCQAR